MTGRIWLLLAFLGALLAAGGGRARADAPRIYLPLLASAGLDCDTGATYAGSPAFQVELDNPPRPADLHADKNPALRGHAPHENPGVYAGPMDYGQDDPVGPPQLAGLFAPPRNPFPFLEVMTGHHWQWAPSPAPGSRGGPIGDWDGVTVAGVPAVPGEIVRAPSSGYDIGGGYEVLVLYAAPDAITLSYTRDDSIANGYALHIEGVCVDPALLALYDALDGGARYVYCGGNGCASYALPALAAGQPIGRAAGDAVIVAVRDRGAFMDPRSCEWWAAYCP